MSRSGTARGDRITREIALRLQLEAVGTEPVAYTSPRTHERKSDHPVPLGGSIHVAGSEESGSLWPRLPSDAFPGEAVCPTLRMLTITFPRMRLRVRRGSGV